MGGTVRVEETLAADTSCIADADGLSGAAFSYQWIRNDGTSARTLRERRPRRTPWPTRTQARPSR